MGTPVIRDSEFRYFGSSAISRYFGSSAISRYCGRVLRIRDEDSTFIDVDPNEETDDDSDDELRHRLPDINSDTEEDSSDDSDYEP